MISRKLKKYLMGLYANIISKISKEDNRSKIAIMNIIKMIFLKGLSIAISFLIVPITINYVNTDTYGIWLTLSSMVAWMSFFDIGLSNGLKNKLAIAIAQKNNLLGKKYVSTTYAMLMLIFLPLMLILCILVTQLEWTSILNLHSVGNKELTTAIIIVVIYFCNNFVLSTINIVLLADQKPADASFRTIVQQAISLLTILVLTASTQGNLVKLCCGLCVSPLFVNLLFNITLFKGRYRRICPSFKAIDFKCLPEIVKLGVMFFIIQIAGVIQFQMVNFLMIRQFGPDSVTEYNIAYKLFNGIYLLWGIFLAPLWVAVADSKVKNDWAWIHNSLKRYIKLFILFFIIGLFVLLFSPLLYNLWVGNNIQVGYNMSLCVFVYTMSLMFGSIFVNILNGLGELKIQTIACIISPFIFLVVTYIGFYFEMGPHAIIIASIVSNFNGYIIAPIQCKHVLKKESHY